MTQTGTVIRASDPEGFALVRVVRRSACAHDCASCGGCAGRAVTVQAWGAFPAEEGDEVELRSGGGRVLSAAALVYLAPVALFLLGCLLPAGLPEGPRYLCGGAGFALGLGLAALWDRRLRRSGAIRYQITRKL